MTSENEETETTEEKKKRGKGKPKTSKYYLDKLAELAAKEGKSFSYQLGDLKGVINDPTASEEAKAAARQALDQQNKGAFEQLEIEPSEEDTDTFQCGKCDAELPSALPKCPNCGAELSWE